MDARERLLAGIPATEQRLRLAGIPTTALAGGDGPPVVLLPGHGASGAPEAPLDPEHVLGWLGELIERTCPTPPVLVGRITTPAAQATAR